MKIESVEVFAFKYDHHYRVGGHAEAPNRLPGTDYYFEPQWRHAYSRLTESCLVKITTDTGLVGWGEAQAPLVPEVPATLIAKLPGPAILGLNPLEPEEIYNRLYHLNHVRGHTASFTIDAITALDIALWDIKGQAEDKPLHQLLGGARQTRLPLYVSGVRLPTAEERQAHAREIMQQGFKGVKIFFGNTPENTLAECRAMREAIGPNAELAFDAICRHGFDAALQIGHGLDELNATWFESPIDPEDVAGHAKLARAIKTPLAIGEPLRTVREFEPWFQQKAMRVAQPDIVRCGITGGKLIVDRARELGLAVGPHIGVCTAIGFAATWHFTAVLENAVSQEHQLDLFDTANKVLQTPLQVEAGHAVVPTASGLGIEVNEVFVRANSAQTWLVRADQYDVGETLVR